MDNSFIDIILSR